MRLCKEIVYDKAEEIKSIEKLCVGYSFGTEVRGIYGP
jgi:hypothetical protein